MRQTAAELKKIFASDAEQIASELSDHYGLFRSNADTVPDYSILRWMDFVARYIAPRPRQVFRATHLQKPSDQKLAALLDFFEKKFKAGNDMNSYQGAGLIIFHDPAGEERLHRTDHLWADWNIHHLHLTKNQGKKGSRFGGRSGTLLFVSMDAAGGVAFVDVGRHEDLDNDRLLTLLVRNWPDYMEQFRMNRAGAKAIEPERESSPEPNAASIHDLRLGGVNMVRVVDGNAYLSPGGGISTAATAIKMVIMRDRLYNGLDDLAEFVASDKQFTDADSIAELTDYHLEYTEQGLMVHEKFNSVYFKLPRALPGTPSSSIALMADLLYPIWVEAEVASSPRSA